MLNEPSAAGFEYTHRHARTLTSKREHVVVYDLGGGTFDASLVRMHGDAPRRRRSPRGCARLGGDDFDAALASSSSKPRKLERGARSPRRRLALADAVPRGQGAPEPELAKLAIDLEACLGDRAHAPEVTIAGRRLLRRL